MSNMIPALYQPFGNSILRYEGYMGSIEFSQEDQTFFGKLLNCSDLVLYKGETLEELRADFHDAVQAYQDLITQL